MDKKIISDYIVKKDENGNEIRYDRDGKFINENTEIIKNKKDNTVTFINRYKDGIVQKYTVHLKDKEKNGKNNK